MRFDNFYSSGTPAVSFEFFPPREAAQLSSTLELIEKISRLNPHFMTVTYGAGGGTRALTQDMVSFIHNTLRRAAAAHLTCVNHSVDEIDQILNELKRNGINKIVALRGDPPKGTRRFVKHPQGFSCARDLVEHIRKRGDFSVAVAGYPETHREASSKEGDLEYLKEKVEAGAEVILTQLFFTAELYFSFVEDLRRIGVTVPVVPGIMPVGNIAQIERFTTLCGASIPPPLRSALTKLADDPESVISFGIDYAVELCSKLIQGGAPGIHMYTLNKSAQVVSIVEALRASNILPRIDAFGSSKRAKV